jgi:4a-hydroxytetrahydrobiopterin dehydratase
MNDGITTMRIPPGWDDRDGALHRRFVFKDFAQAWGFMAQVALIAERHGHHPDWWNSWNVVEINLTTHDAGATITDQDRDLAEAINALV